jgi:hypothetical protein
VHSYDSHKVYSTAKSDLEQRRRWHSSYPEDKTSTQTRRYWNYPREDIWQPKRTNAHATPVSPGSALRACRKSTDTVRASGAQASRAARSTCVQYTEITKRSIHTHCKHTHCKHTHTHTHTHINAYTHAYTQTCVGVTPACRRVWTRVARFASGTPTMVRRGVRACEFLVNTACNAAGQQRTSVALTTAARSSSTDISLRAHLFGSAGVKRPESSYGLHLACEVIHGRVRSSGTLVWERRRISAAISSWTGITAMASQWVVRARTTSLQRSSSSDQLCCKQQVHTPCSRQD